MWQRMAYSESLFLFGAALALLAMQRRWPVVAIALIIGSCTATRPVGVCLLLPFGLHLWQTLPRSRRSWFAATGCGLLVCWGIIAYMGYFAWEFGEPLAFAKTQAFWRVRPVTTVADKLQALALLEPIWTVYVPSNPASWARHDVNMSFLFSLHFFNPLYFIGAVAALVLGARRGWLDSKEIALCATLLVVPYLTRSHEMCHGGDGPVRRGHLSALHRFGPHLPSAAGVDQRTLDRFELIHAGNLRGPLRRLAALLLNLGTVGCTTRFDEFSPVFFTTEAQRSQAATPKIKTI